ncbi:MAG: DUF4121 family protein [Alistipes onderdonkii]
MPGFLCLGTLRRLRQESSGSAPGAVWECREPESLYGDFSTEKWRKIAFIRIRVPKRRFYRGECISFGSEEEFNGFSRLRRTVFAAPARNPSSSGAIGTTDRRIAREWDASMLPLQSGASTMRPNP